jgi:ABC-2 type transport system permease protein
MVAIRAGGWRSITRLVSLRGIAIVARVECAKVAAQLKARLVLAVCVVSPFVFGAAMRLQDSLPSDTLFGRAVKESGFATPLVILGFAGLWVFPVIGTVIGGDLFSAEDRYGTWKTVLTRSRGRAELFAGKVLVAMAFSAVAVAILAACSIAAGVLLLGTAPLINLSGLLLRAPDALRGVVLAWASVLPPVFALTAVAVMVAVVTRSSAAGIGLPVLIALTMQLVAMIDGPEMMRRLLITSAFEAWHGLLTQPAAYRPLAYGAMVSIVYLAASLAIAYRALRRRDIGG